MSKKKITITEEEDTLTLDELKALCKLFFRAGEYYERYCDASSDYRKRMGIKLLNFEEFFNETMQNRKP